MTTPYVQLSFSENLGNGITLEMVAIPGGTFLMGSPRYENECPQHEVNVPPFFISKYPITQAQWQVIAATAKISCIELKTNPSRFIGDELPVERVNYYEAMEFCKRLSRKTKREYRLPSELEWEYACRAGAKTPFHFWEPTTAEPAGEYATPVRQFPPNAFGLCGIIPRRAICYDDIGFRVVCDK